MHSISKIIKARLKQGWTWQASWGGSMMLCPPDERIHWCAEWKEWKPGHLYPHWIGEELEDKN